MTTRQDRIVLAIDPGRHKCGLAVVRRSNGPATSCEVIYKDVLSVADLFERLGELVGKYGVATVVVGNGTNSDHIASLAQQVGTLVAIVDEKLTSVAARKRFFQENPPKGWRKLIPISLQTPWRPFDDYVAVILAERYLQQEKNADEIR